MKWVARFNTRRRLTAISLLLMVVLLVMQLVIQQYFIGAMREQYMVNMEITISKSVDGIRGMLSTQERVCSYIVQEQDIGNYAATRSSQDRYRMAFMNVRPIIRVATQYLSIDHLIIFDVSDAWFQFIGALDHATCRALRDGYQPSIETVSSAMVLEGKLFFCSTAPIYQPGNRRSSLVGFVTALTAANTLRGSFALPDGLKDSTLFLHDKSTILLSNEESLEGQPLTSAPLADSSYYVKSEQVLPGFFVTISIPGNQMFPQRATLTIAFMLVALCFVLALTVTLSLSSRWFSRPIEQVINQMDALTQPGGRLTLTGVKHIDRLVKGVSALMERLEEANKQFNQTQQTLFEAEMFRQSMELHLLKKQINAHFLFNCLIGVQALANQGDAKHAGEMAEGVALFVRYSHDAKVYVNVFDEMRIIERYVDIMNLRFDNRFEFQYEIDDRLCDYRILRLLLQPLVENALVHGLEKKPGRGLLQVFGTLDEDVLRFTITDNGGGISESALHAIREQLNDEGTRYRFLDMKGISLVNIQKRIRVAYGEGYGLEIESVEGGGASVHLRVPAQPDTESPRDSLT